MLNTTSLELTNSIGYDLTWKTVRKGVRSSSRKPARRLGLGRQQDDKVTKKKSSSASESEKHGVDILGRHFTGKINHVPIKKRRLMLSSASTPRKNSSPHDGGTPQCQSTPPSNASSAGQCFGLKSMSDFYSSTDVQFSQGTEDGDWTGKQSRAGNKQEDLSGIILLADTALQSIADDTLEAKGSLPVGDLSTPVAIDPSLPASQLKITSTFEGTTPLVQEVVEHDDNSSDVSRIHINGVPVENHEKRYGDAEKIPASRKDDRLHWDLNKVMESWELPDEVGSESLPTADEQMANVENLEGPRVNGEPCVELSKHSTEAEVCTQAISTIGVPMEIDHLRKQSILLDLVVPEKIALETTNIQSKDQLVQIFDAPEEGRSPTDSLAPSTGQMFDVECPATKVGKLGLSLASPEHDNLSASGTTFEEGQPAVAGGIEETDKGAPAPDASQKDYFLHIKRNEVPRTYNFLGEASVRSCDYGGYDSDVSQGGHSHIVAVDKRADIETGYESPFEDGELRESDIFAQEDNAEEAEGETECVDFDLNDRDAGEFDVSNQCLSEVASVNCHIDKGSSTEKIMYSAIPLNESSYLLKEFSGDRSPNVHEHYINRSVGAGNVASHDNVSPDQVDRFTGKASSGEVAPRETRGRMFRQPEDTFYSGRAQRQNNTYMQRGRYRYDPSYLAGKVTGSGKPLRRHQDENEGPTHWLGSCGNLRKLPPSVNDDLLDEEERVPRSGIANSAEKVDRPTHRYQRRLVHQPSGNYHQPFRRRSPSDRDDYSVRRRVIPSRDGNHFRRGRPGIFRHDVSRVPKDEYYGPMCDSPPSSVQQPHYSARRERSFSPVLSRENSLSHPRRRSRSKSRSPPVWHLQRERTMAMSPPSRSTDFRNDTRMERGRIPFRKSNFAEDDVFMSSPPRRRFSPPCQPRWIDNRKGSTPVFRGRKSPGRFPPRSPRFHPDGSPERMKSDDCYRPTTRPGRFSEMPGGGGRGRKYDAGNRMKYHDRYEFPNRLRQYETSPVQRRFSCDAEE